MQTPIELQEWLVGLIPNMEGRSRCALIAGGTPAVPSEVIELMSDE